LLVLGLLLAALHPQRDDDCADLDQNIGVCLLRHAQTAVAGGAATLLRNTTLSGGQTALHVCCAANNTLWLEHIMQYFLQLPSELGAAASEQQAALSEVLRLADNQFATPLAWLPSNDSLVDAATKELQLRSKHNRLLELREANIVRHANPAELSENLPLGGTIALSDLEALSLLDTHVRNACSKVVRFMMRSRMGFLFNYPINPAEEGLEGYDRVVTRKMDLGTILLMLNNSDAALQTVGDFAEMVRRTFQNAMTYSGLKTAIGDEARRLKSEFDFRLALALVGLAPKVNAKTAPWRNRSSYTNPRAKKVNDIHTVRVNFIGQAMRQTMVQNEKMCLAQSVADLRSDQVLQVLQLVRDDLLSSPEDGSPQDDSALVIGDALASSMGEAQFVDLDLDKLQPLTLRRLEREVDFVLDQNERERLHTMREEVYAAYQRSLLPTM
jgi:Bromodomain